MDSVGFQTGEASQGFAMLPRSSRSKIGCIKHRKIVLPSRSRASGTRLYNGMLCEFKGWSIWPEPALHTKPYVFGLGIGILPRSVI